MNSGKIVFVICLLFLSFSLSAQYAGKHIKEAANKIKPVAQNYNAAKINGISKSSQVYTSAKKDDPNSGICTGSLGDPIVNITFGSGENPGQPLGNIVPGASTTYNYVPVYGNPASPVVYDGSYTITNNTVDLPPWFSGMPDHTPGDVNGYMAFFNSSATPGEFYKQTVTDLCGNTKYEFAAWIANVLNPAVMTGQNPNITFSIETTDGNKIASFATGEIIQTSSLTWNRYGFFFSLPMGISDAVLKIVNTNPGGDNFPGNDFALDDITFKACGPQIGASFDPSTLQDNLSICAGKPFTLYGDVTTQGQQFDYLWQMSNDQGATWSDVPNSNNLSINLVAPANGAGKSFLYRMLSAELGNIGSKNCRVVSNIVTLAVLKEPCSVETVVVPSFTSPDSVCVNAPVQVTNTSTGASSYYWSFCTADINQTPTGDNLGNINNSFSLPVYSDIVNVNGNYYVFIVNNYPGSLVRLDYGNSLLNNPVAVSLGNLGAIPNNAEGIQIVSSNNKYYAIIVGGDPQAGVESFIVKIDFGSDITNTSPAAVNWGNLGNLSYPHDLYMFNENGNWYGFTTNFYTSTITKFNFGSNFNLPPAATNIGNIGNLSSPVGIFVINDEGQYRTFITNATSNTLTRLDFGTSLLNTPVAVNLGNLNNTLHSCWDIYIIKYCNEIKGFIVNGDDAYNDIVSLTFPENDLTKVPVAQSLGNIGNLSFPHALSKLFRAGADVYSFIPNAHNNTLTRIKFPGCTSASIASSTAQKPSPFSYSAPGIYNITLSVDEGLPTQSSTCRQVVVIAPPSVHIVDTAFCDGNNISLVSLSTGKNYVWNTGATTNNISVSNKGKYWVTTDLYGCKSTDSFYVSKLVSPLVALGNDTALCKGDSLIVFAKNTGSAYLWQDGSATDSLKIKTGGTYSVAVTNFQGCTAKDTIKVSQLSSPVLSGLEDKLICRSDAAQIALKATGTNNSYTWQPNATLSALDIPDPVAKPYDTTTYYVAVKNENGCVTKDSVSVNVVLHPEVKVGNDTAICKGDAIMVTATAINANNFSWLPVQNLNRPTILNPIANPANTISYTVLASNGVCSATGAITINVLQLPMIAASNDTTICGSVTAQLLATGANTYSWFPANTLNNPSISNPVAAPSQTEMYYVKGTGDNGCMNEDSVKIIVTETPVFSINPTIAEVCLGDSVLVTSSGGDVYSWNTTSDILQPDKASTYIKPTADNIYKVVVTNNTCKVTETLSAKLFIAQKPVIEVKHSNDIDCAINTATLFATGASNYSWFPSATLTNANTASPLAAPYETTVYHVKATGANGCITEDSVMVKVTTVNNENAYQLASAFTPNNDGLNDCFGVKNWSLINSLDLSVYDRLGNLVFHSNRTADCWDGTYKGIQQPVGTYVYLIRAKTLCGNVYKKGTVVVIR